MKVRTNILVNKQTLTTAQDLGLNVSRTCENALNLYIQAMQNANTKMNPAFLGEASFAKEGSLVRSPRFEPGSSAWQADVLDQARLRPHIYGLETFCRGSYFPFLNTASGHKPCHRT